MQSLIYALLACLGGMAPSYTFPTPDNDYPASFYIVMRALPALAGSFLPLLVYALACELGGSASGHYAPAGCCWPAHF